MVDVFSKGMQPITMVSYYGHVHDPVANQALMQAKLRFLHGHAACFIIAGDFKVTPNTMAEWIGDSVAKHAKVFLAGDTCHTSFRASSTDYFI
jgi:hypothetical protein